MRNFFVAPLAVLSSAALGFDAAESCFDTGADPPAPARTTALLQLTQRAASTSSIASHVTKHDEKLPTQVAPVLLEDRTVVQMPTSAQNESHVAFLQTAIRSAGSTGSKVGAEIIAKFKRATEDADDMVLVSCVFAALLVVAGFLWAGTIGQPRRLSAPLLASGVDVGRRGQQQAPRYNDQWAVRQHEVIQPMPFKPAPDKRDFVCC